MQESIVNESPRRRIVRRVAAAVMALAAVLTLGACRGTGGGYIDEPVPSGVLPEHPVRVQRRLQRRSKLRLQLHLRDDGQEQGRDQGPDHLPRHQHQRAFPGLRLHGTDRERHWSIDPMDLHHRQPHVRDGGPDDCLDAAQFEGTYRSQETSLLSKRRPAGSPSWCSTRVSRAARTTRFITGDGFSIELPAGALRPLHPGRLHRGRQHPGGQHLGTVYAALPGGVTRLRPVMPLARGATPSVTLAARSCSARAGRTPRQITTSPRRTLAIVQTNGGMDMAKSPVNESPRRRIARRVGAAGMALAAVLVLGACRADGRGVHR